MKKDREEKTTFSKILPNNQIITKCRIELQVQEMTMNGKLTMISLSVVRVNEQLAKELYKPVIKKFKRRKVYARFKNNIWGADLAEMESLSSKNKNF